MDNQEEVEEEELSCYIITWGAFVVALAFMTTLRPEDREALWWGHGARGCIALLLLLSSGTFWGFNALGLGP